MAIKHGKKNVKTKSKGPAQQKQDAGHAEPNNSFMVPPAVPGVDAPGQDLGFEPPGPGQM